VVPDFLHIFPGLDDTGLDWIRKVENTSLLLSLVADVLTFGSNALHASSVLGSADNSGEYGEGGVLTSETGLDHT